MSDHLTLETVDANGAVREAYEDLPALHRELIKRGLLAGGTLAVGGVAIGGLPSIAAGAPSPAQDVKILNFALTARVPRGGVLHPGRRRGASRASC